MMLRRTLLTSALAVLSALGWLTSTDRITPLPRAGDAPEPRPAVHAGPVGGPIFCMAPPVPQKTDWPVFREPAPELALGYFDHDTDRVGAPSDTSRVLFLLAEFADVPFDTLAIDTTGAGPIPEDELLVAYFDRHLEHVRQYYEDVSFGQHVMEATVHDAVVKLPAPMAYYGDDDLFSERGTKLIWDAVAGADADVDFGDYNGFAVVHSGSGQESDVARDSKSQIWSAFFPGDLLSFVLNDSLGYEVPGIPTDDLTAEGDTVYVRGAALLPENEVQDGWRFGLMGVFTHELGHVMIGWPDLYDTTPGDPSQGVGAFCLMAAGTWNGNGFVPGEPCVWSRYYAGWLDPVTIADTPPGGRAVTLTPIETDRPAATDTLAVRIPISADEYFLVEARQPDPNDNRTFDWARRSEDDVSFNFWGDTFAGSEFDYFTPNLLPTSPTATYRESEGLYVWHIDDSVVRFAFDYNLVNADPHHLGIDLEEADGVQDLEFDAYTILSFGSPDDAFRPGTATEFGPWTNPSSESSFGAPGRVLISDIGPPGETQSFRVEFVEPDGAAATLADGFPVTLDQPISGAHPLAADLDGDRESEFVVLGESGLLTVLDTDGRAIGGDRDIGDTPAGSPLVGDVLGDGGQSIVTIGERGGISVFEMTATALRRRPAGAVDSLGRVEGVLADVDDDAALELIVGSRDAGADSTEGAMWRWDLDAAAGREYRIAGPVAGAPVVGRIAGAPVTQGGAATIPVVVQAGLLGGMLLVDLDLDTDQRERAPTEPDRRFGSPVWGDLDGDDTPDVVAVAEDGTVFAWELGHDGDVSHLSPRAGWPVFVGGPIGSEVSIADVDSDGFAEVLAIGTSGAAFVINLNGVVDAGWPRTFDVPQDTYYDLSPPHRGPLAADVTGDGRLDVIPVFGDGLVVGLRGDDAHARVLRGWPLQVGSGTVPVVGDFDGDARTDVFALDVGRGSRDEVLWTRAVLWNLDAPYRPRGDEWGMFRRGPTRNAVTAASESDVPDAASGLADVYCQPNPARPDGTSFHYRPAMDVSRVTITIYDAAGIEVRRLDGTVYGGVDNLVRWDGLNESGTPVAPGLYVYRVASTGGRADSEVGKLALIR